MAWRSILVEQKKVTGHLRTRERGAPVQICPNLNGQENKEGTINNWRRGIHFKTTEHRLCSSVGTPLMCFFFSFHGGGHFVM